MISWMIIVFILVSAYPDIACASRCACATTSVHIRSGPGTSHSTLGTTYPGFCFPFKGDESKASGYEWAHIDYNGQNGWIAENYVQMKTCPSSVHTASGSTNTASGSIQTGICLQWGPTYLPSRALTGVIRLSHDFNDVGYSFLIGEDGNAYEGRGWDIVGAHTKGYNSVGLGFCIMGNFMERLPDSKALLAVKKLIACGVSMGKIQSNYVLRGHRDVGQTACPGDKLYAVIKTWPHY